jgi:hypothetical protein
LAGEETRPRSRTTLAWRRTGFGLFGVCLVGLKLTDLAGVAAATVLAVVGLCAAGLVVGFAEGGVKRLSGPGARAVFPLLLATTVVVVSFALVGVVLSISA